MTLRTDCWLTSFTLYLGTYGGMGGPESGKNLSSCFRVFAASGSLWKAGGKRSSLRPSSSSLFIPIHDIVGQKRWGARDRERKRETGKKDGGREAGKSRTEKKRDDWRPGPEFGQRRDTNSETFLHPPHPHSLSSEGENECLTSRSFSQDGCCVRRRRLLVHPIL